MSLFRLISMLVILTLIPASARAGKSREQAATDAFALYSAGGAIAERVKGLHLSSAEQKAIIAGFTDAIRGKEPRHNIDLGLIQYDVFREDRIEAIRAEKEAVYADYFAEQESVAGTERLDSGMLIRTTTVGHGATPNVDDHITIHYAGKLLNGRVFDSSYLRGKASTFDLATLIPCWKEGLQHMKVGGAAILFCPPHLGYGEEGAPPSIPGDAVLYFEVKLVDTEPAPEPSGAGE